MDRIVIFPTLSFLFFFNLLACGDLDALDDVSRGDPESKQEKALLFTGSDVTFSSSQLFRVDYEAKQLDQAKVSEPMLSGSGDMVLFKSNGRLFLFNRRAEDLNFRQLTVERTTSGYRWVMGEQIRTPQALAGDPHAVLVLDDETIMLANYVKGVLAVVNYKSGALIQSIRPRKILGQQAFRPESLLKLNNSRVAVLHQGYDEHYSLNESQSLFIFDKHEDETWQLADDGGKVGLKVSVPQGLFRNSAGDVLTIGLCPSKVSTCQSGVELIDTSHKSSELLMEFDNSALSYFGRPTQAGADQFLMSVEHHHEGNSRARLALIDYAKSQVKTLYKFPDQATSGYWGNAVDLSNQLAFFGDALKSGDGRLRIFDLAANRVSFESNTDLIPYSLVVVSPEDIVE